jgi:hypothetical protein
MKIIDKIAFNRFVKIIADFILGLIKIFKPDSDPSIVPDKKRKPLRDLLDRWRIK